MNFLSFKQVVNTTSEKLSDVAIEASVWDLEGTSPYYKVFEKLSIPGKKTVSIAEMKYPKAKNAKPVYFLLLKLYRMSDNRILSRNFYWLHLPGGDYKQLEAYKKKKVPLKITSKTYIIGSTFEMEMCVKNKSKKPNSESLTDRNDFVSPQFDGDYDMNSLNHPHTQAPEKAETGLFQKVFARFTKETDGSKVAEVNGTNNGVAFFLNFSVHGIKKEHTKGEDTRILPVHYSDNYFSLVPGEEMTIKISFEAPSGVTPRVTLNGWNYHGSPTVL